MQGGIDLDEASRVNGEELVQPEDPFILNGEEGTDGEEEEEEHFYLLDDAEVGDLDEQDPLLSLLPFPTPRSQKVPKGSLASPLSQF